MKIVITGGHHSSALPVIKNLKEKYPSIEILWIGHKYSMKGDKNTTLEYREITGLNIPFYDLKAGKFYKTYNISRLIKIPWGFIQSFYFLIKIRPKAILSFGGYLAAPVVISGSILRIPSITHEQTVVAGYSNRLISFFAKKVLISWEESRKYFPNKKVVYTGLPLRKEIFNIQSDSFKFEKDLLTIYISAGKTGSHIINENVLSCMKELLNFCNIIHQCGDNSVYNDFEKLEQKYIDIRNNVNGKYYLRRFVLEDEIGEAYMRSDLVISRSGAHTISEIIALKKPALLIPIPWVSHNEQYKNAKLVKDNGLGEIFEQKDLTPENLVEAVKYCISKINSYKLNDEKILEFLNKNPSELIINEIIKLIKKEKK